MGDLNQYHYVKDHCSSFTGPFLEIGSRDYGTTWNMRPLFPGQQYIGVDMSEGKSVDLVFDLTKPFKEVDQAFNGVRFNTIFCLNVMEHCDQPFRMAENLEALLAPGGKIYISVPFAWKFHGYPSDYWRFTQEGVKKLFPGLDFDNDFSNTTTSRIGETLPLNENLGRIFMSGKTHRKNGHYLRGLSADILKILRKLGFLRWLTGYRYVMAPTMINMVGIRPE
ncbi:MAG: hypothetical protein BMS9Abin11_0621 [Gammaproteobacteria bacterium]|nr:MAG: hypothetical protein BMS9Abin11_0621 [Gammaproteobacteria bacterium]